MARRHKFAARLTKCGAKKALGVARSVGTVGVIIPMILLAWLRHSIEAHKERGSS